jgi:hypothetical protein
MAGDYFSKKSIPVGAATLISDPNAWLTEAGERLYTQIAPAVAEMRSAIETTAMWAIARVVNCGWRSRRSPKLFCQGRY